MSGSQSSQRYSKGKGRSRDTDYVLQSFDALSLSDPDPLAPRSDYYDPSYTDAYSSSYEPTYTSGEYYALAAQGSHAPTPSSSATYGSAGVYSTSYPATSATSSTRAYEYQSEASSTPSYGGYAGYDTPSVAGSSIPSYGGGGGSVSGWSESQSRGTAASSVPSRQSHQTDVNNTIHQQNPTAQRYQLPCEFHNLTGCDRVFPGDDTQDWINHVDGHLRGKFPSKLRCWFCSDHYFDASQTSNGDARSNFIMRMEHIRDHLVYDGSRPEQMQKDGHFVRHLLEQGIIDSHTYDSIVNLTTVPPIPGQSHHSNRRSHHSRLPQVQEDVAPGESSSRRNHHRSDHHRSDHRRSDHHRSDHHRSDHHRSDHRRNDRNRHGS